MLRDGRRQGDLVPEDSRIALLPNLPRDEQKTNESNPVAAPNQAGLAVAATTPGGHHHQGLSFLQRASSKWKHSSGYDKPTIHEPTLPQRWFFYKRKIKGDPTKVVERSLGEQPNAETFRNFVALPSRNRGSDNKSAMLPWLRSLEFISMEVTSPPLVAKVAEKLVLHV
jgi:hypothetical protein